MKTISKLGALLLATTIIFGAPACKKEKKPETETPSEGNGNGNGGGGNQSSSCMTFIDLDTQYDKVIYLDFIDDNNGWAIGYNQTNLSKRILMNTADGGTTWSVINNDLDLAYDNGYTSGEALLFINATDGYRRSANEPTNNNALLEIGYTTDKGATWTSFPNPFINTSLPNNPYFYVNHWSSCFASNGDETIFFGTNYVGTSNYYLFVIKVNNTTKAISYSHYYTPTNASVIIDNQATTSVHFAQNGTVTAAVEPMGNGDIQMVQSIDFGTTWTVVKTTNHGRITTVDWVDDNTGFVFLSDAYDGGKFMYKTADGGATWTNETITPKFQMARFADANNGIGATDFDFYYTTDGGVTWTEKTCYTSDGQYAAGFDEVVAYPSVNNGWVAGSKYYDAQGNYNSKDGLFNFTGN